MAVDSTKPKRLRWRSQLGNPANIPSVLHADAGGSDSWRLAVAICWMPGLDDVLPVFPRSRFLRRHFHPLLRRRGELCVVRAAWVSESGRCGTLFASLRFGLFLTIIGYQLLCLTSSAGSAGDHARPIDIYRPPPKNTTSIPRRT
jgi:hypothetical protein